MCSNVYLESYSFDCNVPNIFIGSFFFKFHTQSANTRPSTCLNQPYHILFPRDFREAHGTNYQRQTASHRLIDNAFPTLSASQKAKPFRNHLKQSYAISEFG